LNAFLEEQAQLKKKGVKRLGSENIKTPVYFNGNFYLKFEKIFLRSA